MANFNGMLKNNEIMGAIFNMIISQQVFGDNVKGTYGSLADKAKVDGGLHGDTKLYYATDALKSAEWGDYAEAANLLAIEKPASPKCQAITLDKFRQISLTLDNYKSKRAFSTEGAFSDFQSVMKGWIRDTKRIYDATTYNSYIGTVESAVGRQTMSIEIPAKGAGETIEAHNHLEAETIAEAMANLFVDMKDVTRDFNDYGFLRSYDMGDIKVIWNSKVVNKIRKIDLPTIFHSEGLMEKFDEEILPARYFGKVNAGTKQGDGKTVRSLVEQVIGSNHYFAGDLIKTSDTAPEGTSYTEDPSIICKVVVKLPPFMSAFEVGTSFFNPRSLTETNYLTWGHNTLQYLENYPLITIRRTDAK